MELRKGMLREDALKGQVIVVTGGGTGLGRSMATYFLELGAHVCITSRKQDVLDKAAAELREQTKGEVLAVACDVRKYVEVEQLVQAAYTRFGRVDGLVNNAAGNFISPTERLSSKAFEVIIDIVLMGSGERTRFVPPAWLAPLFSMRIGLETMDTFAACRTYNILAGEGRNVVVALIIAPPSRP